MTTTKKNEKNFPQKILTKNFQKIFFSRLVPLKSLFHVFSLCKKKAQVKNESNKKFEKYKKIRNRFSKKFLNIFFPHKSFSNFLLKELFLIFIHLFSKFFIDLSLHQKSKFFHFKRFLNSDSLSIIPEKSHSYSDIILISFDQDLPLNLSLSQCLNNLFYQRVN